MKKNKLLNIAIIICKLLQIFYVIVFIGFTGLYIHSQISPESYKEIKFDVNNLSFNIDHPDTLNEISGEIYKDENPKKLISTFLIFHYFQFSIILLFIFLSVKEFRKVMESIKNLKTFQTNNVISFRKIGKYIFIIFLLMSFSFYSVEESTRVGFQINFTPLILTLIAFILAEIFKEGNYLKNENDLTI